MIDPDEFGLPSPELAFGDGDESATARRLADLVAGDQDQHGRSPFDHLLGEQANSSGIEARTQSRESVPVASDRNTAPIPLPLDSHVRPSRAVRGRVLLIAAVVLLVAVVGTALISRTQNDGERLPTLDDMVERIAQQPDIVLGPAQYWHERRFQRLAAMNAGSGDVASYLEQWVAKDGTGAQVYGISEVPITYQTQTIPTETTRDEFAEPRSLTFVGLTYDQLRGLPHDPQSLRSSVRALLGPEADDTVETYVDLAASLVAAPGTRAASLQVLQEFDGSTITYDATRLGFSNSQVVEGRSRLGSWAVMLDRVSGVPQALFVGFESVDTDTPDLESALKATRYGTQDVASAPN